MQAPNHQNIKPATQEHQTINTTDGVKTLGMCSAQYWSIKPLDLVNTGSGGLVSLLSCVEHYTFQWFWCAWCFSYATSLTFLCFVFWMPVVLMHRVVQYIHLLGWCSGLIIKDWVYVVYKRHWWFSMCSSYFSTKKLNCCCTSNI